MESFDPEHFDMDKYREDCYRKFGEEVLETIQAMETPVPEPTPVYDGWLNYVYESGKMALELNRRGNVRAVQTWHEIDPGDIKDHVAREEFYYHIWVGDERVLVTDNMMEAAITFWQKAGKTSFHPFGAETREEGIRRTIEYMKWESKREEAKQKKNDGA